MYRYYRSVGGLLVLAAILISISTRFAHNGFDAAGGTTELFVSPSGNDSWPGTATQPFLTIDKAKLAARSLIGNVTVNLRGGVYELSAPISLGSSDSGKSGGTITYRSYTNEAAVIRGSKSLDGYASVGSGIYEFDLTANGIGSVVVSDVYINGIRLSAARFPNAVDPNFNATDPWIGNFLYAASDQGTSKNSVKFSAGTLDTSKWTNPTTGKVNVFGNVNYTNEIQSIASVNPSARQITFSSNTLYDIMPNNRFYISHIREELDAPGEWFYDSVAKKLLLIPPAGVSLENSRVSVPVSDYIFSLNTAHDIRVENLVLEEVIKSPVYALNSHRTVVNANFIRHSGQHGVYIHGRSDTPRVERNELSDLGQHGIYIVGDSYYRKTLNNQSPIVSNNHIFQTGVVIKAGYGVAWKDVVGGEISHNEIHNLPRLAIFLTTNNVVVDQNLIYDLNKETEDSGGIYTLARSWLYRGNHIRNNVVKDTGGYGYVSGTWKYKYYTRGIYLDDYSSGNFVYNNIVARTVSGAYMVHGGMNNSVYNNIAANDSARQTYNQCIDLSSGAASYESMWTELQNMAANGFDQAKYFVQYPELSQVKATMSDLEICSANKFYRNILYYPGIPIHVHLVSKVINTSDTKYYKNLFWPGSGVSVTIRDAIPGATLQLPAWQALGYDTDSIVADPLFKDAAHDNFELDPSSPALGLGFEPIVTTVVGTTESPPDVLKEAVTNTNKITTKSNKKAEPAVTQNNPVVVPPAEPTADPGIELNTLEGNNHVDVLGYKLTVEQFRTVLGIGIAIGIFVTVSVAVLLPRTPVRRLIKAIANLFAKLFRRSARSR